MRVIFSRKGFDSAAGKVPSPIIDGQPISLPIPTGRRSETTYRLAGLGRIVEEITKGRICADDLCHEDPVFSNGCWAFGQTGKAQAHLKANGVGVGDVFLFFGLFASRDGEGRHHRIFGYMQVGEVRRLGSRPSESDSPKGFPRRHPHTIGEWEENNTLYIGVGAKARTAHPSLRLTAPGAVTSIWNVPEWLKGVGLTYHSNPARWTDETKLCVASRGQEFVSNISDDPTPRKWLEAVQVAIRQGQ
jgi:Nucleotide modification associated domain 3